MKFNDVLNFYNANISGLGLEPAMKKIELIRTKLLNNTVFIVVAVCTVLVPILYLEGLIHQSISLLISLFIFSITYYFVYKKKHELARFYFIGIATITIVIQSYISFNMGVYVDTENVLLLPMVLSFLLLKQSYRYINYLVVFVTLIYLKHLRYYDRSYTTNSFFPLVLQNITIISLLLFWFLLFTMKYTEKNLEELEVTKMQLEKANASNSKVFSIIAHDIKSPINSFEGLIAMIKHKNFKSENLEILFSQLEDKFEPLKTTLNDLLSWSVANIHDVNANATVFNTEDAINEIVASCKPKAEEKQITISIEGENQSVHMDYSHLIIALRNIGQNAIKFSKPGSTIRIIQHQNENFSSIEIIDSGIGIAESKLEEIRKGNIVTSSKGTAGEKGTGLGLTLVKELLEKNNCKLVVSSTPEEGSSFKIIIPTV